jgi:predicted Fe-S protein YdhL (DUF1289 family)
MIFKIDTPCIGICSTVYGDQVCRGCKRQYKEVIDWNAYTSEQKALIYQRLDQQMQVIVGQYLQVDNPAQLESLLKQEAIRYRDDQHPLSWALFALMFADSKIRQWSDAGLSPHAPYASLSPADLCNLIDKHLYEYSQSALA